MVEYVVDICAGEEISVRAFHDAPAHRVSLVAAGWDQPLFAGGFVLQSVNLPPTGPNSE